ncbi:MAG: CotH kinase family protein [bacterium]|jgi:uncharacterized protein (TIGR03437 family)
MSYRLIFLLWFLAATSPLAAQDLDGFFDGSHLQQIRIRMAPADWAAIHENYLDNGYYRCDFSWNGLTLPNIGMRSRGSQSRSPIKPSIGLDFSRYLSTQRFLGLKTLVLRNLNQDASMMRERLAESVFRRAGLPYSREAHARLYVNDEYVGVYLLVEPIDERFLKTRLGEDTGFLYEVGDTSPVFKFDFRGLDPAQYVPVPFEPKTRTKDPEAATGIVDMVRLVNETPDDRFIEEVRKVVDLPAFLAHAATEEVLAQWDGILGGSGMNNIYLYRRADGSRALPLVWDQDGAFTDDNWSVWNETEQNILFRRALTFPEWKRRFTDALEQSAAALGAEDGWMQQEVEKIYQQIRPAVYEDPVRLCRVPDAPGGIGNCTLAMFEDSVAGLRSFALRRRSVVQQQLAVELPAWKLEPNSLTSLVGGAAVLVPGSLATLSVPLPLPGPILSPGFPLPKSLSGFSIETEAGPADLLSLGPGGAVFVVPPSLPLGPSSLRLARGAELSNWLMVLVQPTGGGLAGLLHSDGAQVSPRSPAAPGEALAAFGSGLWIAANGAPPPGFTVLVAGQPATVLYAGPAPGWIGVQQVNFAVPPNTLGEVTVKFILEGETGGVLPLVVR